MIRLVSLLFVELFIININCTTPIGYISNATYFSSMSTNSLLYNGTCFECICYAFFSSIPSQYIGLNCYINNNTCQLFANYSLSYMIQRNVNSAFVFLQSPSLQIMTTVSQSSLTSAHESTAVNTYHSTLVSTTSTCVSTVTPVGRGPTIVWDFEGNLHDRFNIYNGTAKNNPTYGLGRNGCGKCLNLSSSLNESVYIYNSIYMDLRNMSFSLETWIKPMIVTDGIEHVILTQCGSLASYNCMRFSIGNPGPMTFRLRSDTQTGSQNVPINVWSHLAYVYNVTSRIVSLYLNGTFDISGSSHGLFQGLPTFFQIGNIDSIGGLYYDGCIDEIFFYRFARTATEIAATFALG